MCNKDAKPLQGFFKHSSHYPTRHAKKAPHGPDSGLASGMYSGKVLTPPALGIAPAWCGKRSILVRAPHRGAPTRCIAPHFGASTHQHGASPPPVEIGAPPVENEVAPVEMRVTPVEIGVEPRLPIFQIESDFSAFASCRLCHSRVWGELYIYANVNRLIDTLLPYPYARVTKATNLTAQSGKVFTCTGKKNPPKWVVAFVTVLVHGLRASPSVSPPPAFDALPLACRGP